MQDAHSTLRRALIIVIASSTLLFGPAAYAALYSLSTVSVSDSALRSSPVDYKSSEGNTGSLLTSVDDHGSAIHHDFGGTMLSFTGASAAAVASYGILGANARTNAELLFQNFNDLSQRGYEQATRPAGAAASAFAAFSDTLTFHAAPNNVSDVLHFGIGTYSTLSSINLDVGRACSEGTYYVGQLPHVTATVTLGSGSITVDASPCETTETHQMWNPLSVPLDTPVNLYLTLSATSESLSTNPYVTGFGPGADAYYIAGSADASHTAVFGITLPDGLSYTSASGTVYATSLDDPDTGATIPEPATPALIGLGVLGLLAFRWRRDVQ